MDWSWCYDLVGTFGLAVRTLTFSSLAPAPLQAEERFPEYGVIKATCSPWCPLAAP